MAKELPYFKFEPGQWDNGNVQLCSNESKGLFIDVCSMYWSRVGELPYKLAVQKLCSGNANALQELFNESILMKDANDNIVIDFLDEQLKEFSDVSAKRSAAANKRWEKASAMQMQSKSNAIREEKIIGDKNKKDSKGRFTPPTIEQVSDYFTERGIVKNKGEAVKFIDHYQSNGWMVGKNKMKDWKAAIRNWISRMDGYGSNGDSPSLTVDLSKRQL